MGIFRIIFWGQPSKPRKKRYPKPKQDKGTPIRSVRRRYWWLGDTYGVELKLEAARNQVKIDPDKGVFTVSLNPPTRENFESYMDGWYRRNARKEFEAMVDYWLPLLAQAGYPVAKPRLKIFDMRRAWGRCYYTKGLVTLNLNLIKTPPVCVRYIILHELCHFIVHNHSKEFHGLMAMMMPEWKEADKLLKDFTREYRIIR